jgi:leukotriene-A4 hydrolase
VLDLEKGEDPDDVYSTIPYEKGSNFLLHIERTLGGLDVFLPFIRDYVKTYTGKSITTQTWKEHLYGYYDTHDKEKVKLLDTIDWDVRIRLHSHPFRGGSAWHLGMVLRHWPRVARRSQV